MTYARTMDSVYKYVICNKIDMSKLTITNFRSNIYNIIDGVIDTGIPKTIERKGYKVKIILDDEIRYKFDNLEKHSNIICDPDLLISEKCYQWSEEDKI